MQVWILFLLLAVGKGELGAECGDQVSGKGQEWQPLRWTHQLLFLTHFSLAFCLFVC